MSRLLTPEEEAKLLENGLRTDQGNEIDPPPVVKLFAVNGPAIWLLTEISAFYPGLAFGLCDLGMGEPELGNMYMPELESTITDLGIWAVEKDEHFVPQYPLSVYTEAAKMCREITEDPDQLEKARISLSRPKP